MTGWKRLSFWWTARIRDEGCEVYDPHVKRWRVVLVPKHLVDQFWPDHPPAKPKRHVPRTDYRADDEALFPEMRTLIASGKAKDATDAARALLHRIAGSHNDATKLRRLAHRFLEAERAAHRRV
jgi:hypothetical protein